MNIFAKTLSAIAAATLATVGVFETSVSAFTLTKNGSGDPLKIMPLGDSITRGHKYSQMDADGYKDLAGYRDDLWALFQDENYDVDFVGSERQGYETVAGEKGTYTFDADHQGLGGFKVNDLDLNIENWLNAFAPDVVLLMAGTNDFIQQQSVESTQNELKILIDKVLSWSNDIHVFVSSIAPLEPMGKPKINVEPYNSYIAGLIGGNTYQGANVSFVDNRDWLTPNYLISDGIHLNSSANAKLANSWFSAMQSVANSPVEAPRDREEVKDEEPEVNNPEVDTPQAPVVDAPENNPVSVPEPASVLSILAIGAFGASSLMLERKK